MLWGSKVIIFKYSYIQELQAIISFNLEVIYLYNSIYIDPKWIDVVKSECNDLDFGVMAPFKIFLLKETCGKILEYVKKKQIYFI